MKRLRTTLAAGVMLLTAAAVGGLPTAAQADPDNELTVTYDAVGTSHIGNQVDADLPIGPTTITVTIDTTAPLPTPIIRGNLPIPEQTLTFDVFGIPTRAKVKLTQVGTITGTLTKLPTPRQALDLKSQAKYDIKLSNVEAKVFGKWFPLGVGSNCHTKDPITIKASSKIDNSTTPPSGYFTINGGGVLVDKYTIGAFTGCTPLNYFDIPGFFPTFGSVPINALVPGSNNTLSLTLDNPRNGTS